MADYIVINGIRIDKDHANFVPQVYGRWTAIGPRFILPIGNKSKPVAHQVCQCSCGSVKVVASGNLVGGITKSCGCLKQEPVKQIVKHGEADKTTEYSVWVNVRNRCYNANDKGYKNYGGRGIRVCDRWLDPENGYANFLADMGRKPSPRMSINRKVNNGDYSPSNCEWSTSKVQMRNRRCNRMLTAFGKTQCLAAWAEETGIGVTTIRERLSRGWNVEKAVSTPPRTKRKKL